MTIDGEVNQCLNQVPILTTGIGSLPHHNVDTALEYSFRHGIPFLPQIPIRNPWEFMIAQALEGLPGLQVKDEAAYLNFPVWQNQSHLLTQRLGKAFAAQTQDVDSFESFEPSAATLSCWQPFLWELQERGLKLAKIQIAGPFTCQFALQIENGPKDLPAELASQIYQTVLAKSLAMVQRMKACSIQPILFIDEPGLYTLLMSQPSSSVQAKQALGLKELSLMIRTLKQAGAIVGLHCCSNTAWDSVLDLGMDILSIDCALSLANAAGQNQGATLENFIQKGGRLSLGIIPTTRSSALRGTPTQELTDGLLKALSQRWESNPALISKILSQAIYTPACGLALHTVSDAELILEKLVEVYEYFHSQ